MVEHVEIVNDVVEAINYIKRIEFGTPNTPIPDLIFLDINMPKMNGWEFLETYEEFLPHIRERIKIVMLSTTQNPNDIKKASKSKTILELVNKPLTKEIITKLIKLESSNIN